MRMWYFEGQCAEAKTTQYSPMPFKRIGSENALDDEPKYDVNVSSYPLEDNFNQAFFDRMYQRINQAAQLNIYVSVMLFQGWSVNLDTTNPWPGHPLNSSNNIQGVDGKGVLCHTMPAQQIGYADYKMNPIFMDSMDLKLEDFNIPSANVNAGTLLVRKAMGDTLTYADKVNLKGIIPQDTLSSTGYCLAQIDLEYLVLQIESNEAFTVELQTGTYTLEWWSLVNRSVMFGLDVVSYLDQVFHLLHLIVVQQSYN